MDSEETLSFSALAEQFELAVLNTRTVDYWLPDERDWLDALAPRFRPIEKAAEVLIDRRAQERIRAFESIPLKWPQIVPFLAHHHPGAFTHPEALLGREHWDSPLSAFQGNVETCLLLSRLANEHSATGSAPGMTDTQKAKASHGSANNRNPSVLPAEITKEDLDRMERLDSAQVVVVLGCGQSTLKRKEKSGEVGVLRSPENPRGKKIYCKVNGLILSRDLVERLGLNGPPRSKSGHGGPISP